MGSSSYSLISSQLAAILAMLLVCALTCSPFHPAATMAAAAASPMAPKNAAYEWSTVKQGLMENKKSMCSFLLIQVSDREVSLTLDRTTELFEQALDHIAKSTEYSSLVRPFVSASLISSYDQHGGELVIEISDARRQLISEYNDAVANGASDEERRQILEKYFYKACQFKLGAVIGERSMYDSMLKIGQAKGRRLE